MIDALLCFPSFEVATQVGVAMGYVSVDDIDNPEVVETIQATHDMAICVIGEHYIPSEDLDEDGNPIFVGDGKWWVLVRAKMLTELPEQINPFVAWSSLSSDPQPLDNPMIPARVWA